MSTESANTEKKHDSKVKAAVKSESPNFVGSAKDRAVRVTAEDVEKSGKSKKGLITTELILGNIGTGSVLAVIVKGHKITSITFEITSAERRNSSKVHGVETASIDGIKGTSGVTVKVKESEKETDGGTTSG